MKVQRDILKDSTGKQLAKANDIHTTEFFERFYTQIPESLEPRVEKTDAYFIFRSQVEWPMMNSVLWLDAKVDQPEIKARQIAEFLGEQGYGHMWWLGEHSTPAKVYSLLDDLDISRVDWEIPVMGVDLRKIDYSQIEQISENAEMKVERVSSKGSLKKWLSVAQEVYNFPDSFVAALEHIHGHHLQDGEKANVQCFVAEINRTVVGISALYLSGGLAGLYYVGTLKEYRGRGVGSAVTVAALQAARENDYQVGILGASKLGLGVYKHIGFREYYKLYLYIG